MLGEDTQTAAKGNVESWEKQAKRLERNSRHKDSRTARFDYLIALLPLAPSLSPYQTISVLSKYRTETTSRTVRMHQAFKGRLWSISDVHRLYSSLSLLRPDENRIPTIITNSLSRLIASKLIILVLVTPC
jgi:hypothetical protein